jgi:diguanylate cyclase (GGDEF)-like protein
MGKEMIKGFLSKPLLDTPDKKTIIDVRWIVILACCCLLLFARKTVVPAVLLHAFCLVYVLSNVMLYTLNANRFTSFIFFAALVLGDTAALSVSLLLTNQLGSDLYLTYFLVIVIAGFWKDLRWSLAFAVVISCVYAFLLFIGKDVGADTYLRIPFLFTASVFYGYVTQLVSAEHQRGEVAEQNARMDFLTGLPNRKALDEKLKDELERANRYGGALSFLIIDIDNFKSVNDSLGHQWGDRVLRSIGGLLKVNVRTPDFVARFGGEEFALLLPETELSDAVKAGNRLRQLVMEQVFHTPRGLLTLTISAGAASRGVTGYGDWEQLYADADRALYMAKKNGKNQVAFLPREDSEPPNPPGPLLI